MIIYYVSWIDKNDEVQVKMYKTQRGADNFAYNLFSNNENNGAIYVTKKDIDTWETLDKYSFN